MLVAMGRMEEVGRNNAEWSFWITTRYAASEMSKPYVPAGMEKLTV